MPDDIKRPRGRPPKNKEIRQDDSFAEFKEDGGFVNYLVGLGGVADRSNKTFYSYADIIDDSTLTELYLGDGLSHRIIDAPADDMTREWIYLKDDDARKVIMPILDTLSAEQNYNTLIKWSRLYGGGILLIGAMDGQPPDKPLREDKIRNIEYLRPIDRTCIDLSGSEWDKNPNSPNFGKIIKYKVSYTVNDESFDMMIHYTRVIEYKNNPLPMGRYSSIKDYMKYWGGSSLQAIYPAIRDLGGITQSVVNLLYSFSSGTYKFKNLGLLLAQGGEQKLAQRLRAIEMSTSILNARVIDAEESFSKEYTSLASIPEVIDRFMLALTGSTGIPVTRLFGRSPAGLNSTGESDLANYYDIIEADQRNRLLPAIRRLVQLIAKWQGLGDEIIEIEFNSLYQLTEEEKAKIELLEAQAEEVEVRTMLSLIDAGIRDPVEYAKELGYEDEYTEPVDTPENPPEENGNDSDGSTVQEST